MNTPRHLLPALLACLGLWGCDADKTTGTMDETNQSAMARIYLPDHTPAAKALVQAWRVDDSTKTAVAQTETSEDGSYRLGDLPEGLYRVVARKDGLVAMQDSMPTVAGRISPRDDTLGNPAVATGTVRMTGSDNPSSVTILVVGTDILFNVDKSGSFKLEGLATGTYRLRLSSTIAGYTTTAATIRVTAGRTTDVGTIRMNFIGIPPVDSLAARIDTASNRILLSWQLPEVRDFRFVRVYREPLDGSEKPVLVGYSTGNSFQDSIGNFSGRPIEWLYTARIHTLDGDSGYPAWVKVSQGNRFQKALALRTSLESGLVYRSRFVGDTASIGLLVIASPERPRSLVMSFEGKTDSIPLGVFPRAGSGAYAYLDSMVVKLPFTSKGPGKKLRFVLTGSDGSTSTDSITFDVFPKMDSAYYADSLRSLDSARKDWRRVEDSIHRADSLRSLDSARQTDSVNSDTGSSQAPDDPDFTPWLHASWSLARDTVVAGTDLDILFRIHSRPFRAKSLSWSWNGTTHDTLLAGWNDSTRRAFPMTDSVRISLPAGSVLGSRWLVATATGQDGRSITDSIRVFVIAPKSVASVPGSAQLAVERQASPDEVVVRLDDSATPMTESDIPSALRLEEDA